MNYQLKKVLLAFIAIAPVMSLAQEDESYATATITTEYCVSLDSEATISEFYEIDISHLHLPSEIEANNKFGYINNNLLTYTVDFEASKAYLHVHLDRTPEPKDIVWWNSYIESLCGL